MKITISGLGGTGTSTVGKLLADGLGYVAVSGGDMFRAMAKEQGMTILELDEYSKEHPEFDIELDKKQAEYGKGNNNFVFESRIGWYFIPDAFKIKLTCDLDERIRRVTEREGGDFAEAKRITLAREATYQPRYQGLYQIDDWQADEHFDVILDATVLSAQEIVDKILTILKKKSMPNKSPRTVLFYGMSGAGKGTQARLLVDKLQTKRGTHFIEVGQMLRDYAVNAGTYGALKVRETIDNGGLVPPAIAAYLWSGKLLKSVTAKDNAVFDGAARSINEAKLFDTTLKWLGREYSIFVLEIDGKVAKERAIARGEDRADDTDEAMNKRLAWFNEQTMPAIEYMKEQGADVYHIDGGKSIDDVHAEILAKLDL